MTGLPDTLAPKVARLVRLLGSPVDGESLAAARALDRTLKGAGPDLHDLAAIVERPEPAPRIVYQPAPPAEPPRSYSRSPDPDGRRRDRARVQWLLLAPETLREAELDFLRSIRVRLAGGRPLTSRQSEWLDAIYARASREYA
jgi:hypothetical protein